jgi:hypothetical protein
MVVSYEKAEARPHVVWHTLVRIYYESTDKGIRKSLNHYEGYNGCRDCNFSDRDWPEKGGFA